MTRIYDLSAYVKSSCGVVGNNPSAPLVFWDGYGLDNPYSGIYRHARCLSHALQSLDVSPVLLGNVEACSALNDLNHFVVGGRGSVGYVLSRKAVWPQYLGMILDRALQHGTKSAILHGLSNFNVPWMSHRRHHLQVLTVHDVIPLLSPSGVSKTLYWQFRSIFRHAIRASDAIICVSEWTRRTLLERYPWVEEKCIVISNGVESSIGVTGQLYSLGQTHSENPRILYVSRYEEYKRIGLIPEILRYLPKQWSALVVTDSKGKTYLEKTADQLIAAQRLKVVCGVSRKNLQEIYKTSDVYVHPSRFEGYCLPAVEALQAGLPIVYQSGSAVEELSCSSVGIGMTSYDSPYDWARAAEKVNALRQSEDWGFTLEKHLKSLPTWLSAAQSLKNLYNTLR